ncbi:hypothetical protein [Alkalihalobacillus sp. R86527]|uniref:hypothetical protein n=1 Tax=Alkalihalobacillus sp. R86527 TaxID=3093863 RepID=UPI00367236AC
MNERMKNGIISAITFAGIALLIGYFIYGEIKWQYVIGLSIGGFLSWYFIIPKLSKQRARKK